MTVSEKIKELTDITSLVIITKNEERVVASFQGDIAAVAFQEHLIKIIEAIGGRIEHAQT